MYLTSLTCGVQGSNAYFVKALGDDDTYAATVKQGGREDKHKGLKKQQQQQQQLPTIHNDMYDLPPTLTCILSLPFIPCHTIPLVPQLHQLLDCSSGHQIPRTSCGKQTSLNHVTKAAIMLSTSTTTTTTTTTTSNIPELKKVAAPSRVSLWPR